MKTIKSQKTAKESSALVAKITSVLEKKLFKGGYPSDLSEESVKEVHSIMENLFKLAPKLPTRELMLAGHGILYLIRTLIGNKRGDQELGAIDEEILLQHFKKCVNLFYQKKKLNIQFFTEFATRQPWILWKSVDEVLAGSSNGKTDFLRIQPFVILVSLSRASKDHPWDQVIQKIRKSFEKLLESEISTKRLKEVLSSIHTIYQTINKTVSKEKAEKLWSPNEFKKTIDSKISSDLKYQSDAVRHAANQLHHTLMRESYQKPKKRKTEKNAKKGVEKKLKKEKNKLDSKNKKKPQLIEVKEESEEDKEEVNLSKSKKKVHIIPKEESDASEEEKLAKTKSKKQEKSQKSKNAQQKIHIVEDGSEDDSEEEKPVKGKLTKKVPQKKDKMEWVEIKEESDDDVKDANPPKNEKKGNQTKKQVSKKEDKKVNKKQPQQGKKEIQKVTKRQVEEVEDSNDEENKEKLTRNAQKVQPLNKKRKVNGKKK